MYMHPAEKKSEVVKKKDRGMIVKAGKAESPDNLIIGRLVTSRDSLAGWNARNILAHLAFTLYVITVSRLL